MLKCEQQWLRNDVPKYPGIFRMSMQSWISSEREQENLRW